jgi:hypothetical protein
VGLTLTGGVFPLKNNQKVRRLEKMGWSAFTFEKQLEKSNLSYLSSSMTIMPKIT